MDEARRLVDIAIDDPDADYMDLPGAGTRATTSTTTTSASSAASAGAARSAAAARAGGAAGGGGARAGGVQGTEGGLLARLPSWCVCTCLRRLCAETVEIGPRSVVVLRLLGEGGFSFVYLVEDSRTGEQFALKRIHCQEPEQARAVRQEIAVHLAFDHRHLLPLAGHSFERLPSGGERANLLFPYYPSGTIEDFLQRCDRSRQGLQCRFRSSRPSSPNPPLPSLSPLPSHCVAARALEVPSGTRRSAFECCAASLWVSWSSTRPSRPLHTAT